MAHWNPKPDKSRRLLLKQSGAVGLGWLSASLVSGGVSEQSTTGATSLYTEWIGRITDSEIRSGVQAAVYKNLLPAATQRVYAGHFTINADGGGFGNDTTWPGLDSWQMIGPYLHLGYKQMVEDYFDFVRASQRNDGNIPFAIFSGNTPPGGCLRGLKVPNDQFTYTPPKRDGLPDTSHQTRMWVGLFEHWQTKGYPLSTLAPVCYLLTASEIFAANRSLSWLNARIESIESAALYLLTLRQDSGLIGGSGFYIEAPPRKGCDGVTQCYCVHAFRQLAGLFQALDKPEKEAIWSDHAEGISKAMTEIFWRNDHFAEYLHPQRGLVDSHGLSDVNWAAVAFGLASPSQLENLWPLLMNSPEFWAGDMPTHSVTKPATYEPWEFSRSSDCNAVDPLNDVAAMGRVWYLEALACRRMQENQRLVDSVRKVCRAAQEGYWRERYHVKNDGTVSADGSLKYCEYAAVLLRVVLDNFALLDTSS